MCVCKKVPKRTTIKPPPGEAVKPPKTANKYKPFNAHDSRAIETAFQKLAAEEDERSDSTYKRHSNIDLTGGDIGDMGALFVDKSKERERKEEDNEAEFRVPVNEDRLFDVDIKKRELSPVYWLGPVHDVRRGTWFYQGAWVGELGMRGC